MIVEDILEKLLKIVFFKNKKLIFWCMSKSKKNVLRGLHMQTIYQQDKFVSVIKGKIFDVVDRFKKEIKNIWKNIFNYFVR